jgi:hypothetical protein
MGKGRYTWFFGCKRMKKEGSSVREEIRVTLLANAGVLLEGAGARLLIDGLYDPAGTEFQAVPEPVKARLLAGEPPVDLLAFTHLHPDHFSRRETETYLARNRVRGVLLPEDGGPLAGPVRRMTGVRGTWESLPGVRITWVSSGHIGPQYAETAHFCLLAELSGMGVLVTGDADPERGEPTWQELGWARPDAVLVNPLFYQSPRGGPYCGRCCGRSGWFYTISPARTATLGDCAGWSGGSWSGAGTSPTTCPPCGSLWTV